VHANCEEDVLTAVEYIERTYPVWAAHRAQTPLTVVGSVKCSSSSTHSRTAMDLAAVFFTVGREDTQFDKRGCLQDAVEASRVAGTSVSTAPTASEFHGAPTPGLEAGGRGNGGIWWVEYLTRGTDTCS
jgi:hypothetical protein